MNRNVFVLFSLCLVFSAYAVPVSISRPEPLVSEGELVPQGNEAQLRAGQFEGDMILPKGFDPKSRTRGVAIFGNRQWPTRTIPYDISGINDSNDQKTITDAMRTLMYAVGTPKSGTTDRTACVYFRPRETNDKVYVKIQYGNGCSAHVGYITQQQSTLTLQKNGCFHSGTIQHELMHLLGFYHEQSRPDRDQYLRIQLENVAPGMEHNFNKYAWGSTVYNQGSTYDYTSVMHYETSAFSTNGKPTMVPLQAGATIGRAQALSPMDIAEVRHFYGCTP